jgi:EmrB/QacA subfamily drug resistance transporter
MTEIAERRTASGFVEPGLSEREKLTILGGVLLSMLLAALDQSIVAPAMPTIARDLGHEQYLPWIVTGYLLTATAVAPLYGKISDIYGRRPTLYAALLIFLLGSLISAVAPNMFVLIAGRAVQGIGGGGLFALSQTIIGDLLPPRERARYSVWISATWATASIAGPLLGGTFAEHLHWSLIFWINLPLGAVAMLVINEPLKKLSRSARNHRLDGWGALLLVLATALLLLMLNWGGSFYPWLSAPIVGLLSASLILWVVFAWRLLHASEPLVSLEVLTSRIVLAATAATFLIQAANVGLTVYLPIYLQSVQRLSPSDAGFGLLGMLLGSVSGAAVSGRLTARLTNYKRLALVGSFISALGLVAFWLLAGSATLVSVEAMMVVIGVGMGFTFPILTISTQNAVDHAHLGVATGVLTFLRSLGSALGVAVLGAIALGYGVKMGEGAAASAAPAADAAPFAAVFFAAAIMLFIAFLILVAMPQKPLRGYATQNLDGGAA